MPKKITKGSGITKRETVTFNLLEEEDFDAAMEHTKTYFRQWHSLGANDFDREIADITKWAQAVLAEPQSSEEHSPEWYANEILTLAARARSCLDAGRHCEAMRWACELGYLWGQSKIKFEWEEPALHTSNARKSGGRTTAAQLKSNRDSQVTRAAEVWDSLSSTPEHNRTSIVAKRLKVSRVTADKYLIDAGRKTKMR